MASQQPLEPQERDQRATQASPDVAPSGDPLQPEEASAASGSPPWIVIGLVLLAILAGILLYAIVFPALR
jgi:hypothetical protein